MRASSVVPRESAPVGVALLDELVAALDGLVGHVGQAGGLPGEDLLAGQAACLRQDYDEARAQFSSVVKAKTLPNVLRAKAYVGLGTVDYVQHEADARPEVRRQHFVAGEPGAGGCEAVHADAGNSTVHFQASGAWPTWIGSVDGSDTLAAPISTASDTSVPVARVYAVIVSESVNITEKAAAGILTMSYSS